MMIIIYTLMVSHKSLVLQRKYFTASERVISFLRPRKRKDFEYLIAGLNVCQQIH